MNAIFARKSVRTFTDQKVDKDSLLKIVHAGMAAPSAMNVKPWQFIVIEDPEQKKKVSSISPYARFAATAKAVIIALADTSKISRMNNKWEQDLSAATENMLLQIVEEGLGGCWIGLYPNEDRMKEISSVIQSPSHIIPFSIIALGHTDAEPALRQTFDDSIIHWDRYAK
ncbi:MAG: nitroreductase family protein [Sphaerochaetaceae bacterium]